MKKKGQKPTHSTGVAAQGVFIPLENPDIPPHKFFVPGEKPIVLRHANVKGKPADAVIEKKKSEESDRNSDSQSEVGINKISSSHSDEKEEEKTDLNENKKGGGFWSGGMGGLLNNLVAKKKSPTPVSSVADSITTFDQMAPSTTNRSVLLSVWTHCSLSVTGFGAVTPFKFRNICVHDFNAYLDEVRRFIEVSTDADSFDSASLGEFTHLSSVEHSGMVLAATIAALLDLWDAPILSWKEGQINGGCVAFLALAENPKLFCEVLSMKKMPVCDSLKMKKIAQARELSSVWKTQYERMDMKIHPARFILSYWCMEAIRLLDM